MPNFFSLKRILFLTCFLVCTSTLFPQDIRYARRVIDTLCSQAMHGRGYVGRGDKLAAEYISNEWKAMGMKTVKQKFKIAVNTFPGNMHLTRYYLQGDSRTKDTPQPGAEFTVAPSSPSVKGAFPVMRVDTSILNNDTLLKHFLHAGPQSFLLLDTAGMTDKIVMGKHNILSLLALSKGWIIPVAGQEIEEKLKVGAWDISGSQGKFPVIEMRNSKGLQSLASIDINIDAQYISNYTTQNIIGIIKGAQVPDSFVVFTAHYDHLGQMGKNVYFPGANDNASGTAMLLNLAKYYAKPEHAPKYSIVCIAFGAEEAGLLGSKYFTEHPLFPLAKIKFLINMDLLGTGDEGLMAVNGEEYAEEYQRLLIINEERKYLPVLKKRPKAANSDQYWFTEKGVHSFFFYTMGGIKAYHDIYDRPNTLPLTEFEDVFRLIRDFVQTF